MAIVRRSSTLPIPADLAFELAQKIELFEFVVAPFLQIRSIDTPDGIAPGATVSGRLWWLGMVPSWRHSITIVELGDRQIYTNEHGGPVRMITPQLYAWKGAKWIRKIEFRVHDRPGFWEERGYSNSAHPWREDRYS